MREERELQDSSETVSCLAYSAAAYRLAAHLMGFDEAVEDVVQQAYVDFMQKPRSSPPPDNGRAWFLRIVAHKAHDFVRGEARRRKREAAVASQLSDSQANTQPDSELVGELRQALRQLDEKYRLALALCVQEGLTHREAALILDIPERTVSEHIKVGLERLRKMLGGREKSLEPALMLSGLAAAAPEVPSAFAASIKTFVGEAAAKAALAGSATAAASSATLGGLLVKISLGLAAAALLTVGVLNTRGGSGAEKPGGDTTPPKPGAEPSAKAANGVMGRSVTDRSGNKWLLEDWKQGDVKFPAPTDPKEYAQWLDKAGRPYPKNFKQREEWYLKKNGENWDGPRHQGRTMTPGVWKWEVCFLIPDGLTLRNRPIDPANGKSSEKDPMGVFESSMQVFAPGGGEVTDIYAHMHSSWYHYDPVTKVGTFVGNKDLDGFVDGLNDKARMDLRGGNRSGGWGKWPTMDHVTGRLYFEQQHPNDERQMRYVEKLLPYTENGKEVLLPALLDYEDFYKQVKGPGGGVLTPVMKDGKRAAPSWAVRTTPAKGFFRPGGGTMGAGFGSRDLLTPDGKAAWAAADWDSMRSMAKLQLIDLATGKPIQPLSPRVPPDIDGHGGVCVGLDGNIYMAQHGGCGIHPMRQIVIDTKTGKHTILYDSMWGWSDETGRAKDWETRWREFQEIHKTTTWDGPADAMSISAPSTLYQTQCPRTGAIFNGGWDNTGIRCYLDGFVTSLANGDQIMRQPNISDLVYGRPEWKGQFVAALGSFATKPEIAPNGDLYLQDGCHNEPWVANEKDIRVIRIYRTDWPKDQPPYGYGEKHMPKAKLKELMLEYCKNYVANYAELSKIY
jgi:RNA polymerase sigma-70 factor (ECF subfamily)